MVALLFPCTSLMRATCAPATTLPDWSTTRPVTLPVVTCAGAEFNNRAKPMTIPAEMLQIFRFIVPLPLCYVARYPGPTLADVREVITIDQPLTREPVGFD